MPGQSNLRRYLTVVRDQFRQVVEALRNAKKSPKKTSLVLNEIDAHLRDLFAKAFADAVRAGLGTIALPRLETLQSRRKELLDAAWGALERGNRDKDFSFERSCADYRRAYDDVRFLLPAVEPQMGDEHHAETKAGTPETPSPPKFDDDIKKITLDGVPYPPLCDKRAYDLFKLVAAAEGSVVSKETIVDKIPSMGKGKNTLANTRKKLPGPLQYCLKSNPGREGGLSYRPPKKKK